MEIELLVEFGSPVIPPPLLFEKLPQESVGQYGGTIFLLLFFSFHGGSVVATRYISIASLGEIGNGVLFSGCPGGSTGAEWRITLGFTANTRRHVVLIAGVLTHLGASVGSGVSSLVSALGHVVITALWDSLFDLLCNVGFNNNVLFNFC